MQSVKCYIKHEKSRLVSLMKMFLDQTIMHETKTISS